MNGHAASTFYCSVNKISNQTLQPRMISCHHIYFNMFSKAVYTSHSRVNKTIKVIGGGNYSVSSKQEIPLLRKFYVTTASRLWSLIIQLTSPKNKSQLVNQSISSVWNVCFMLFDFLWFKRLPILYTGFKLEIVLWVIFSNLFNALSYWSKRMGSVAKW